MISVVDLTDNRPAPLKGGRDQNNDQTKDHHRQNCERLLALPILMQKEEM